MIKLIQFILLIVLSVTSTIGQAAITLYDGSGSIEEQGWLIYGQVPLNESLLPPLPATISALLAKQMSPLAEGVGTATLNTNLGKNSRGYAGYANYQYTIPLESISLTTKPAQILSSGSFELVNPDFPNLDRNQGFELAFNVAIKSESSKANRAGFSVIVIAQDGKGIELGFKREENFDRIFAQGEKFTEAEDTTKYTNKSITLNLNKPTDYVLKIQGDGYTLLMNESEILSGKLRVYQFNPLKSSPKLPFNPYETPNFLFFGDDTDKGWAEFTFGMITIDGDFSSDGDSTTDGDSTQVTPLGQAYAVNAQGEAVEVATTFAGGISVNDDGLVPTTTTTIPAGFDFLKTPLDDEIFDDETFTDVSSGKNFIDFSSEGGPMVQLKGNPAPLSSSISEKLTWVDTIVKRKNEINLTSESQEIVEIELVALSLKSISPFEIGFLGDENSGIKADLYVTVNTLELPDLPPQLTQTPSIGEMEIFCDPKTCERGTFKSQLKVYSDLIFVKPDGDPNDPQDQIVIMPDPNAPLILNGEGTWFNSSELGGFTISKIKHSPPPSRHGHDPVMLVSLPIPFNLPDELRGISEIQQVLEAPMSPELEQILQNGQELSFEDGTYEGVARDHVTLNRTDKATVIGEIMVDPQHVGQLAQIVLIAIHSPSCEANEDKVFYMLDTVGNIIEWNQNLEELVAIKENVVLASQQFVKLYDDQLPASGCIEVYFGYLLAEGVIVVNESNLYLVVKEP
jgi:hypothetical protein